MILLAFSLNCGSNAFMFMDFTTIPQLTKQIFGFCPVGAAAAGECDRVGDAFVGWTYSGSLLAVCPAAIVVMATIERHRWATYTIGMGFNCAGGWLRYAAVSTAVAAAGGQTDPGPGRVLGLASSVAIGFGAGMTCVGYSAISAEWFPPEERTFATSCAVQSNYAGWALGAVVFPFAVNTVQSQLQLQLLQAVLVSLCCALFMAAYRENPVARRRQHRAAAAAACGAGGVSALTFDGDQITAAGSSGGGGGFGSGMRLLATNRQYVLQCTCYSLLAGVSFAVPAFQATAFRAIGLTEIESAWTNLAFIGTGVTVGLLAGKLCPDPASYPAVIKTMFVLASISMAAAVGTASIQQRLDPAVLYGLLVAEMMLCGAAMLGFLGIGLSAVVESTHPVRPELSGGTVELFVQVFGAFFSEGGVLLGDQAFLFCGLGTWAATACVLTLYRQEFRKSGGGGRGCSSSMYTAVGSGAEEEQAEQEQEEEEEQAEEAEEQAEQEEKEQQAEEAEEEAKPGQAVAQGAAAAVEP